MALEWARWRRLVQCQCLEWTFLRRRHSLWRWPCRCRTCSSWSTEMKKLELGAVLHRVCCKGILGLVVKGGDSPPRDCGFESRHRILDGYFHINCCKNCNVSLKRPKINEKRPGMAHWLLPRLLLQGCRLKWRRGRVQKFLSCTLSCRCSCQRWWSVPKSCRLDIFPRSRCGRRAVTMKTR